ncbi:MAG: hypothetical protein HOV79_15580 [Hamadaea sp.]|nr:hypothetical protein [Hamadaea sp.]
MTDRAQVALQEQTVVLATVRQRADRSRVARATVLPAGGRLHNPGRLYNTSRLHNPHRLRNPDRLRNPGRPAVLPVRALAGPSAGRHRRAGGPDRHMVALIAAAVALLLAAGISVVGFAAAATDTSPRHGRRR